MSADLVLTQRDPAICGTVETRGDVIECAHCGKKAIVDAVINETQSYHWTALPPGWLAEVGLCDMSGLACSVICAQKLST